MTLTPDVRRNLNRAAEDVLHGLSQLLVGTTHLVVAAASWLGDCGDVFGARADAEDPDLIPSPDDG